MGWESISFTKNEIIKNSASWDIYHRGLSYYRGKTVRQIQYDAEKNLVTAKVRGSHIYGVEISLSPNGGIQTAVCSCPAFLKSDGYCKHLVAVMLSMLDLSRKAAPVFPQSAAPKSSDPVRDAFKNFIISKRLVEDMKKCVHTYSPTAQESSERQKRTLLRMRVLLRKYPEDSLPGISLEIGDTRMFKVKQINEFIMAYDNRRTLEITPKWSYDYWSHTFPPAEEKLLDLMAEFLLDDNRMQDKYRPVTSLFSASVFRLPPSYYKKFLDIAPSLEDAQMAWAGGIVPVPLRIRQGKLPLTLCLEDKSGIRLSVSAPSSFFNLDRERISFVCEDEILLPDANAVRILQPLFQRLGKQYAGVFPMSSPNAALLLSNIFPALENACEIVISNEISQKLYVADLNPLLRLDIYKDGIAGELLFRYGEETVPYATEAILRGNEGSDTEKSRSSADSDRILLRNRDEERRVVNLLLSAGFHSHTVQPFTLMGDDVFDFLSDTIRDLSMKMEIHYSDDLAKLKVRKKIRLAGNVHLDESTRMLDVDFSFNDLESEDVRSLLSAFRNRKRYIRLKKGGYIDLQDESLQELMQLSNRLELTHKTNGSLGVSIPAARALYLDQILSKTLNLPLESMQTNAPYQQLVSRFRQNIPLEFQLPRKLIANLREYQKFGYQWLRNLSHYGFGGILADDMGLGKTLQAIALVLAYYEEVMEARASGDCKNPDETGKPSIVIAPTSLVYNWLEEVHRFAPELPVKVIDGQREDRVSIAADIPRFALIITSYALLKRDIQELSCFDYRYCFVDEAQHIKNADTLNARSVKQLRAEQCFALTGTPIENSLAELWSIFDFVLPGYLYSNHHFKNRFEIPVARNRDESALEDLSRHIRPFVLRRMKKEVLKELPEKVETVSWCEMSQGQRILYLDYLEKARDIFDREVSAGDFEKSHIKILSLLTRLRQICCHPSLFLDNYDLGSGKEEQFLDILDECLEGGHRLLVFSQFTSMLDLLEEIIPCDVSFHRIDGQTPAKERMPRAAAFNSGQDGSSLFLISLKAGGTGLNLTGADTVVHFDPWWNPAVEDQATDRAYRIGQQNSVQVFKLVTRGTIEEKILRLHDKKRELISSVIQPGGNFLSKLTYDEVRSLFEIE